MIPLQRWLTTHAIACAFGALVAFGLMREVSARTDANLRTEVRRLTTDSVRYHNALVTANEAAMQARDTARAVATRVQARATVVTQTIAALPPRVVPPVAVTPKGDSVCLTTTAWRQHQSEDQTRDSVLTVASVIIQQGIPAIRDAYEAALAKDSVRNAASDSLHTTDGRLIRVLQRQLDRAAGPRLSLYGDAGYDPTARSGTVAAGAQLRVLQTTWLTVSRREPLFSAGERGHTYVGARVVF